MLVAWLGTTLAYLAQECAHVAGKFVGADIGRPMINCWPLPVVPMMMMMMMPVMIGS